MTLHVNEIAVIDHPLDIIRRLRELIEAIERRVPQLERSGELAIVREAAALKQQALDRIAVLEG